VHLLRSFALEANALLFQDTSTLYLKSEDDCILRYGAVWFDRNRILWNGKLHSHRIEGFQSHNEEVFSQKKYISNFTINNFDEEFMNVVISCGIIYVNFSVRSFECRMSSK
jgi:hypothetical protein